MYAEIRLAPDHLEQYYCASRSSVCEESKMLTILSGSNYFNNYNYIVI